MYDISYSGDDCVQGETCGSIVGYIYMVFFVLIMSFIMLNLFILILIKQFEDSITNADNPLYHFKDYANEFKLVWATFSKQYQGVKINSSSLVHLLHNLEPPFGCKDTNEGSFELAKEILQFNLWMDEEDNVYFHEVLFALIRRTFKLGDPYNKEN